MIIVVPKGTFTAQQKSAITKKGAIIIECDDPDKVKVINPEMSMDSSPWFMAALQSMVKQNPYDIQEKFVNNLYKRLLPDETEPTKLEVKQPAKIEPAITTLKEKIPEYPEAKNPDS